MIATESDRLGAIVNDLLVAGRLDADELPVSIEPCDPVELAGSVLDTARAQLPEAIDLELRAASKVPMPWLRIRASCGRCSSTWSTMRSSTPPREASWSSRSANGGGAIRFSIADHGLGIPPSEHRRIFEKFYRLDPGMTRGIGGTGLGLYICRELVRRMAGKIWVESRLGEGSTFVVELPAAARAVAAGLAADRAGGGTRTHDLRITNPLLYQLSYSGVRSGMVGETAAVRNGHGPADAFGNALSHGAPEGDRRPHDTRCDVGFARGRATRSSFRLARTRATTS